VNWQGIERKELFMSYYKTSFWH